MPSLAAAEHEWAYAASLGKDRPLAVGDLYPVWWDTESTPPNMARVIEIRPYTGRYTQWFDAVLRLSAPRTRSGWLEQAVSLKDGPTHGRVIQQGGLTP